MTTKFIKKEAIKFGWDTMEKNLWFFVGLFLIIVLIMIALNIAGKYTENFLGLSILVILISFAVQIIIDMGLIKIPLNLVDNKKNKIVDLFSCYDLFFKYIIGSLLCGLIVLAGMILLIIPGIIWGIKLQFFGYLIIDKKLNPVDALKKSAEITKGAKWDLFLFGLLLSLINLLGALCLMVGLFFTVPTTMVAMAFVYRKLLAQAENNTSPGNSNI